MAAKAHNQLPDRLSDVSTVAWRDALVAALERAPSPPLASTGFERLLDAADAATLAKWPPADLDALAAILGSSPALTRYLCGHGEAWPDAAQAYRDGNPDERSVARLAGKLDAPDPAELAVALRAMAQREMYRIGARDLLGLAPLEETLEAVTRLADVALVLAERHLRAWLVAADGDVVGADGRPVGFVVIGLGKLGGRDLNYSSDVDLAYLYESDAVAEGSPEARAFFTRLASEVSRAVGEPTAEGLIFRVDLRLRPEGQNGPLVNTVDNALTYYEGWGDTWERGVYVKARPVAGRLELGRRFIDGMRPFVYRRHLDFQTVEDFREMKERIDIEHASGESPVRDVKLGRGGIRELEFVVQILQLIHGGLEESVRVLGSMPALAALEVGGMISSEQARVLGEAYRFLRNTEHAIQVVERRQTQRLPDDEEELRGLARRLGYGIGRRGAPVDGDALEAFERDWKRHTEVVHRAFVRFLELRADEEQPTAKRREDDTDPRATELLHLLARDREDDAAALLEQMGFADGARAAASLMRIYRGRVVGPASPQRRRAVESMTPSLLRAAIRSSDPESAVERLVEFLVRTGAHTSYLALLSGSPATMEVLVRLFATSPYLAAHLVGHPELIDSLVRSDHAAVGRSLEQLRGVLDADLSRAHDEEAAMADLRRFRTVELLRIGLADLAGAADGEEVRRELSLLAETCLVAAADFAKRLLEDREPGSTKAVDLAIIAMGKMGGREMSYGSDLDLLFVYEGRGKDFDAAAHDIATRWSQKTMSLLQSRTADGIVYAIDARLRPSGRSGPLVASLARFRSYHESEAELWERQAYLKARIVYGNRKLASRVAETIESVVYGSAIGEEDVREIDELRARVEVELAREGRDRINIKTGRGGIVDIEYIVQMLQLRHGHRRPELRSTGTLEALHALRSAAILSDEDAEALVRHYRFLRQLEARMRLERDRPVEELGTDASRLTPLAKRLGFDGDDAGKKLLDAYDAASEEVRGLYERWFDRAVDV